MKIFNKIILAIAIFALASCTAVQTSISKRNLEVQTRMSDTIFLDPVAPSQRTVFVQVRNTSDRTEFNNLEQQVKNQIALKGYKITDDPTKAHYILQANVLTVGKVDQRAAEKTPFGSYGEAIAGGAIGALALNQASAGSGGQAIAGGLIIAGLTVIADSLVSDVYYGVITDLQISERANGVQVFNDSKHNLKQGSSGSTTSRFKETTHLKRYQTRIFSYANKSNLKWEEGAPVLVKGLVNSVSGIF